MQNVSSTIITDKISIDRLNTLHPAIRQDAFFCFEKSYQAGVPIRCVYGRRTLEEQALIYSQGRTRPGKIVTYAKPGDSIHNYSLALDFCILTLNHKSVSWDTMADYDKDGTKDWDEVVKIFEAAGWTAGIRWKRPFDPPHMQKTFGMTLAQIKKLPLDEKGFVILPK